MTLMVGGLKHTSRAPRTSADFITVDICITTPWRDLESVCLIADLLQRRTYPLPTHFYPPARR